MQDLLLVLALVGVIVLPVLIATRIGNRKPQTLPEKAPAANPSKTAPIKIAVIKGESVTQPAILTTKG